MLLLISSELFRNRSHEKISTLLFLCSSLNLQSPIYTETYVKVLTSSLVFSNSQIIVIQYAANLKSTSTVEITSAFSALLLNTMGFGCRFSDLNSKYLPNMSHATLETDVVLND